MKRLSVRLPPKAADLVDQKAEELGISKNAAIICMIMAQERRHYGATMAPSPRAGGRRREEKKERIIPLVSPKGELFLSSFSSLFSNKPEFDCPKFHDAWTDFVEMRADRKSKPPALNARGANVLAGQFANHSLDSVVTAIVKSTMSEWTGVYVDQEHSEGSSKDHLTKLELAELAEWRGTHYSVQNERIRKLFEKEKRIMEGT